MQLNEPKRIVVIGGGTGTYTVLSGLKKYPAHTLDLSAIVTVADSGGSTGRLRDEFGYLPVGDFRMALTALADDTETGNILRKIFLHRFNKGTGLSGHNFGNLFLIAMTEVFGSEEKAIELASKILRIQGKVLPISNEKLTLVARYESGKVTRGEAHIDEPEMEHNGQECIDELWVEPKAPITKSATEAIHDADILVFGPGDLYTSTLANVVVKGAREAMRGSGAKIVYIMNLMTKYGQTHSLNAMDHVLELEKYLGMYPHYVMINQTPLQDGVLAHYEKQQEYPVVCNFAKNIPYTVIRGDFLAKEKVIKESGDVVKRSLIRHDSDKLAKAIVELL